MHELGAKPLGLEDVAWSSALVVFAGVVSVALRLDLERRLAVAASRMVVQLFAVGYVLTYVFAIERAWLVAAALLGMTIAAGRSAVHRSQRKYQGVQLDAFVTLLCTGTLTTAFVTQGIIQIEPWYNPRYVIPLLGMVFGNALTGISLCLDHLLESLDERRDRIEMALSLGATAWEACRQPLRESVRRGMIPTINTMTVAGIVSLPGMMTGQILAGSPPLIAVAYQVVVMFMLSAACALGCMIAALLVHRRLFTDLHQLNAAAIVRRD